MGGECRNCGVKGAGGCENDWIGDMEMMELGMWGRAQTFRCHERRDIHYCRLIHLALKITQTSIDTLNKPI